MSGSVSLSLSRPSLRNRMRLGLLAGLVVGWIDAGGAGAQDGTVSGGFGIVTFQNHVGIPPSFEPGAVAVDDLHRVYLAFPRPFSSFTVVRLLANGAPDTSFAGDGYLELSLPTVGGEAYNAARPVALAVQPDHKVLVAVALGTDFGQPSGQWDFGVWRLETDGDSDGDFGAGGVRVVGISAATDPDDYLAAMHLDLDGKIVLAGASRYAGDDFDFGVARLTADGDLDPTFSGDGVVTVAFDQVPGGADGAAALAPDAGGYVVLGDALTAAGMRPALARIDPAGVLDTTWAVGGRLLLDPTPGEVSFSESVAVLPAGTVDLLVAVDCAAPSSGTGPFLARLSDSGGLVPSFGAGGTRRLLVPGEDVTLRGAVVSANFQRLVWVGESETSGGGGVGRTTVGRLNSVTGSDDLTFAGGRTTFDLAASRESSASVVALSNNEVVLGGGSYGIEQGIEVGNGHAAVLVGWHGILGDGFESGNAGAWGVSP